MLSLFAIPVNQHVLHRHVRLLLRSLNRRRRGAGDCAVLELQTGRKTLNRDGVLLDFKALRKRTEAFRLHFLGVLRTSRTSCKRGIRYHNLGNNLLLARLGNRLFLSLLDALFRILLVRIFVDRVAILINDRHVLLNHNINRTGHSHLSGTSLGWGTRDCAGRLINRQAIRQALRRVFRRSTFSDIFRQLLEQRRYLIGRVRIVTRAQRKLLRNNSGKRIRHLPLIRRLLRHRVIVNDGSGVDRGCLQILRRLEITRRDNTLVIALSDAHRILDLSLLTVRTSCVPTDRVIRIRHQPSSLGGHLGTGTTLIVIRVVLRNIKDRLRRHQRELQTSHLVARSHATLIGVILEHVHRERRILHIPTLNTRIDVHVISVDVAALRRVNRTTRKRTIPSSTSLSLKRLSNLAKVTLSKLVGNLRILILLRTRHTIGALKRQVNRAVSLRRHHYRLSNMGTFAVLSLVRLDNALLVRTLLLRRVTIIGVLPRVNLTRDLIIKVRGNNLDTTSGTVTLTRLVLVVARQRTCILTGLPPHLRLVRRSKTVDRTKFAIVRELTIHRRLASLTIKRTRPLILRLRQPTNMVRLLLKHETTSSNTRTRRTSRKVPRLLSTIRTRGVAARLHIAGHHDGVLVLIWVLTPHADAGLAALNAS